MALAAHECGAATVASPPCATPDPAPRAIVPASCFYQVADIVIDNGGEDGDAVLPITGREARMGPSSTIAGSSSSTQS